ncbi:hypothetical protein GCM10009785_04700 [Brooklawnia cerclae]|uniref:DUF4367 domain-containing protein n=1 Tax=Brooklawnia cerclae TaxID=349934 RepID=A0ABX0SC27_9ACTN|nr:hypothetical protein [Brooklawnia cerclae]NIH55938.1 hypothetical protein [Brooklawnia cerclae]
MIDDVEILREYGPQGPALTKSVEDAALSALLDEMRQPGASQASARRRPAWRVALPMLAFLTVITCVLATFQMGTSIPATAAPLIQAEAPTFPLTIEALPAEFPNPTFNKDSDWEAVFYRAEGRDLALFVATTAEPLIDARTVTVGDRDFVIGQNSYDQVPVVRWTLSTGKIASLNGREGFGPDELLPIAASTSENPVAISPALTVLPEGWQPITWKTDVTTYAASSGEELTVMAETSELDAPSFSDVVETTVQGNPAELGRSAMGSGAWTIAGTTSNGKGFTILADQGFEANRLVEIAQSVQIS